MAGHGESMSSRGVAEEQNAEFQFTDNQRFSLATDPLDSRMVLPQLDQAASEAGSEGLNCKTRDPEFIKYRSMWHSQQAGRHQGQQVDDVRCMFNMVNKIARPVLRQDAAMQEAMVAPRTADQLLLDMQQLGLVRDKGGPGSEAVLGGGQTDLEPILKDLKLVQENPIERPVFHCFLRDLSIDRRLATHLVTIEQADDAFVMMAYQEPSEGQATIIGVELARFPKFPQLTDGFCLSANGDSVVFTCTLFGCVVYASLSGCALEADPSAAAANAEAMEGGIGGAESGRRHSGLAIGRREHRDNQSRNSSQSSVEATGTDQTFNFQTSRVLSVVEANYKLSEPISEHVYDVCIREMSNATNSGPSKSNLYVTNKSNIAVISMSGLKLDDFLFEGLRLPWRLKLYKHFLIIAEKWGSVQIADLDKEHRSLCVTDMQDLCCENGLKSIEVVPEHNLLLLTVYPEGNQAAGHNADDLSGESVGDGAASVIDAPIGGGGGIGGSGVGGRRGWLPGSQSIGDSAEEASWSCHCFHFNPESTHDNPMLRYAQTLRLTRSPLSCVYSESTKRLYILCFHPARNNSALLMQKLEIFHEERGRTVNFTPKQLLPQKDEEEYKAAVDGLTARRSANNEAGKLVEMLDLAGLPVVAMMKAPINLGFK